VLERIPTPVLSFLLGIRNRLRRSKAASTLVFHIVRRWKDPTLDEGWLRSFREGRSIDREGKPLPWIAYGAIRFLESQVRSDLRVFEYGAGNSTRWWAARVSRVVSCESDADWVSEIRDGLPSNASIRHVPLEPPGAYETAARDSGENYDIIVIDGRRRVECARHSLEALTPNGIVIFDNSERRTYAPALAHLSEAGFKRLDFTGLSPIATVRSRTSIFHRDSNCLGL
jgi:precorrin-6B methylase 2